MKISELKKQVSLGEDSRRQFKADLRNADSLAAEIAAFANAEGCTFTVTVHRTTEKGSVENDVSHEEIVLQQKSSEQILQLLGNPPEMTILQLAREIGISTRAIEKQIAKLQKSKRLKRIGSAKGGHWQVS